MDTGRAAISAQGRVPAPSTFVEALRAAARERPEQVAFTQLVDGDEQEVPITYAELDRRARAISVALEREGVRGGRVLLLLPSGLDFIAAFFGVLYAGCVVVPVSMPSLRDGSSGTERFRSVAADARPALVLTRAALVVLRRDIGAYDSGLAERPWLAIDGLDGREDDWCDPGASPGDLAMLQYTSGSTSSPKGVMLTHHNLIENALAVARVSRADPETDRGVTWLPMFHDMGLVGGVLSPVLVRGPQIVMSPLSFLRRPIRWLRAISRYAATMSAAPDFAYDLCVRKISQKQRADLDLRHWRFALTGAEAVRSRTLEAFAEAFGGCGFSASAFVPAYGLAESTCIATCDRLEDEPLVRRFGRTALESGAATPCDDSGLSRALVGCGRVVPDHRLAIVDPVSREECSPDRVGEIWLAGPSVSRGYWNLPEESECTFSARLADGCGPFLRTGDLGFVSDGELMVCGRLKDLIILNGRNVSPDDVEQTVERGCCDVIPGSGAAFAVEEDDHERLVVVYELDRRCQSEPAVVAESVRESIATELGLFAHAVVLIRQHSLPRTSSGKVRRRACREAYLRGALMAA